MKRHSISGPYVVLFAPLPFSVAERGFTTGRLKLVDPNPRSRLLRHWTSQLILKAQCDSKLGHQPILN
jgi:hypothetical protein